MEPLIYKSVERTKRRFPQWLNDLGNLSGAYIIRNKTSREILYVGESHTGRLANTIKRHFYSWLDNTDREHFTFNDDAVEVAVRITPQKSAKGAQDNLIRRLLPKHNTVAIPDEVQHERNGSTFIEW
ncbi:MAG: hypothetical protein PHP42_08335 [Bacteroidota bacterium]|nr:hypothetical protein [Bacteroidota bacterium]